MRPKHRIDVFPQPPWIKTISCDGKPCGGAAGAGSCSPTVTHEDAGGACHSAACGDSISCPGQKPCEDLAARYDADLQIADYSSFAAIMNSIDELNRILAAAGESLTVTLDNLDLVFSQISPFVAVDGRLAFVGKMPTESELEEALQLAEDLRRQEVAAAAPPSGRPPDAGEARHLLTTVGTSETTGSGAALLSGPRWTSDGRRAILWPGDA